MTWEIEEVQDYKDCIALRREVFMGEQGIAEEDEFDDLDDIATHVLATVDGQPVGTTRLLLDGSTGKIGRICVVKSQRGTGLGAALVQDGIDRLKQIDGITRIKLGAQCYALGFYEKLGFKAYGSIYDDAGIDHQDMELIL